MGSWSAARMKPGVAALKDPRYAYFLGFGTASAWASLILRDWDGPEQVTHIKRIAVAPPGLGRGKAFLDLILDAVFAGTQAYRPSLGLFPDNLRARRAYERAGFRPEGISRGSAYFGGVNRDELVMAILEARVPDAARRSVGDALLPSRVSPLSRRQRRLDQLRPIADAVGQGGVVEIIARVCRPAVSPLPIKMKAPGRASSMKEKSSAPMTGGVSVDDLVVAGDCFATEAAKSVSSGWLRVGG